MSVLCHTLSFSRRLAFASDYVFRSQFAALYRVSLGNGNLRSDREAAKTTPGVQRQYLKQAGKLSRIFGKPLDKADRTLSSGHGGRPRLRAIETRLQTTLRGAFWQYRARNPKRAIHQNQLAPLY